MDVSSMHIFQHKFTSRKQPELLPQEDSTEPDIPLVHALEINDKDMVHQCLVSFGQRQIVSSIRELKDRKVNKLFQVLISKFEDGSQSSKKVLQWLKWLVRLKGRAIWRFNSGKLEQFERKIQGMVEFQSRLRPLLKRIGVKKQLNKKLKPLLTYQIDQSTQQV